MLLNPCARIPTSSFECMSMIWSIIDEPWRYLYDAVRNIMQRISDKIYAGTGYDQDMKPDVKMEDTTFTMNGGGD